MKILALDSSGLVASAAIVEDDVLIAEYTTDYKKTHSQTLLPMLDEIRQMIDHTQISGVENIGSPLIFIDRQILARAALLHHCVFPAARMGAGALISVPTGEIIT